MNWNCQWIRPLRDMGDVPSVFCRAFSLSAPPRRAVLTATALGVYEAVLNGKRVGDYVLAPGWTAYRKRLQYQQYDVTALLGDSNRLQITVGKGWYRSKMCGRILEDLQAAPCALIARLEIEYQDGRIESIGTDDSWTVRESEIRFSEIYDGEICDSRLTDLPAEAVACFDGPTHTLIPQEGEKILERERLSAARIIHTPKGETVIDFGQNIAGYVEIDVCAKAGEEVCLSHGEMLDKDGNFYNENYANAKAQYVYICHDGQQTYHPRLTFYGFRYIRVDAFPGGAENARADNFTAIAVYSNIRRTGYIRTSHTLLNRFIDNVVWSQKGNFLDIPTDCPQRDERLGWTGDAQIFAKAAALNFDVEKFFDKWLGCLRAEQLENGYIGHMIPDTWRFDGSSAAWGDAAIICPWEMYLAYGNPEILRKQFDCMKKRLEYIANETTDPDLWIGGWHYGDWYAIDGSGNDRGGSRIDLIASAYYAHSTRLFARMGRVLGEDMTEYEALHQRIVAAFRKAFPTYDTQTECALAVHFRLAADCQAASDRLAEIVRSQGMRLTTGFVGTPCLLHALSDFGHADIAYSLLLREEYPSWLYAVNRGATTIWEHWNGIREDGTFYLPSENSFNHYAYGSVIDWIYTVAGGIRTVEDAPGYERVKIAPIPDARLGWLNVTLETRHGTIRSEWKKQDDFWRYEIETPVEAEIVIAGQSRHVQPGVYYFYSPQL